MEIMLKKIKFKKINNYQLLTVKCLINFLKNGLFY